MIDNTERKHLENNGAVWLIKGKLRRSTGKSVGYDLFATHSATIPIGGSIKVATGVVTILPAGVAGIIKDRSGLAADYGVTVLGGVIDGDYDKEWHVILLNTGKYPVQISAGDRVAQVLFVSVKEAYAFDEGNIEVVDKPREGGFGSTGK